ncbi:MAG: hypothetical protein R3264_08025 [Anaerolineae bacterium]|nr:hypothetical protein [Anaerolineae bacterium]
MGRFTKLGWILMGSVGAVLLGQLWLVAQAKAQTARIDDFTYFIPFRSENILAQFKAGNNQVAQTSNLSLQTNISIPVNRSGTIIYYDHWEDDYEAA